MSEGVNRVMLLGNLGADAELRMTPGGQAVLKFRLATTEGYQDRAGQRQERTEWHQVVLWGKRGEALSRYLTKGTRVFVEGGLRTSSYDDRDGNKRYKTEVVANNLVFAGGGAGGAGGGGGGGGGGGPRAAGSGGGGGPRDESRGAPESGPFDHDDAPGGYDGGGDNIPF